MNIQTFVDTYIARLAEYAGFDDNRKRAFYEALTTGLVERLLSDAGGVLPDGSLSQLEQRLQEKSGNPQALRVLLTEFFAQMENRPEWKVIVGDRLLELLATLTSSAVQFLHPEQKADLDKLAENFEQSIPLTPSPVNQTGVAEGGR